MEMAHGQILFCMENRNTTEWISWMTLRGMEVRQEMRKTSTETVVIGKKRMQSENIWELTLVGLW